MKKKAQLDEKKMAKQLATMLKKGASYIDVQRTLMDVETYDVTKVREYLGEMVSKDLLVEHDIIIELERLAYRNYNPKSDLSFEKMISSIHSNLEKEGALKEEDSEATIKSIGFRTKYKWAIAGIFLALLGAMGIWKMQMDQPSESLFLAYFEPLSDQYSEIIDQQLTGHGAALNLDRLEGQKAILEAYGKEDYIRTIALSKSYFEKYPAIGLAGEEEIKLYFAISLLTQEQSEKAIGILKYLSGNFTFLAQKSALWYLALAWIQLNDFEKAKPLLRLISQDNASKWQAKATALLAKLL